MHILKIKYSTGLTLIEVLIVISILSFVLLLAIPSSKPSEQIRLELAATEIANAIRYTRDQAIRLQEHRLFEVIHSQDIVRVYLSDFNTIDRHPTSKKTYEINLSLTQSTKGVTIQNAAGPFSYSGLGTQQDRVYFDPMGFPYYTNGSNQYNLSMGQIKLGLDNSEMTVVLEPTSGRVIVQ